LQPRLAQDTEDEDEAEAIPDVSAQGELTGLLVSPGGRGVGGLERSVVRRLYDIRSAGCDARFC
jgi:hypothetical protein